LNYANSSCVTPSSRFRVEIESPRHDSTAPAALASPSSAGQESTGFDTIRTKLESLNHQNFDTSLNSAAVNRGALPACSRMCAGPVFVRNPLALPRSMIT